MFRYDLNHISISKKMCIGFLEIGIPCPLCFISSFARKKLYKWKIIFVHGIKGDEQGSLLVPTGRQFTLMWISPNETNIAVSLCPLGWGSENHFLNSGVLGMFMKEHEPMIAVLCGGYGIAVVGKQVLELALCNPAKQEVWQNMVWKHPNWLLHYWKHWNLISMKDYMYIV